MYKVTNHLHLEETRISHEGYIFVGLRLFDEFISVEDFTTFILNKRLRKPKGQSRIDKLEALATMGTQDTGRKKHPKNATYQAK